MELSYQRNIAFFCQIITTIIVYKIYNQVPLDFSELDFRAAFSDYWQYFKETFYIAFTFWLDYFFL